MSKQIIQPMRLIKNRYRIIAPAGEGHFGSVYQAEDGLLNVPVAIKAIKEQNAEAVASARQEAKLLASLKHENIPAFIDFFEARGWWYLVMEWIEGVHIWGRKPLSVEQVIWFGEQLCDVLSYLHHRQAIVHRDIKPDNILRTREGLSLLDFGISCAIGHLPARPLGCPGYSAPEQYERGKAITPLLDVYSMGVVLRQLLTGQPPSQGIASTTQPKDPGSGPAHSAQAGYAALMDLLKRMTADIPTARPDIEGIWVELERIGELVGRGSEKQLR